MNVSQLCTRIIRWAFYFLVISVPLILTAANFELFEFNKMMVTYAITVIIAGTWIIKMVVDKKIRIAKTPLDIPILLFVLSQLISTIFSMDPHVSWMGYYSRFNGGMWSVITYVILYYAFVTNFTETSVNQSSKEQIESSKGKTKNVPLPALPIPRSPLLTFLRITIGTAVIVALYGVLERMGIDKHLWVQDVQDRVFSTLGQPNWLAAYLVALMPISMAFSLPHSPTIEKGSLKTEPKSLLRYVLWTAITVLFFVVLLFTRSRSGLLGLAIADVLFWAVIFIQSKFSRRDVINALFLHILFGLIIFVNGSNVTQIDKYFSLNGLRTTMTKQVPDKPAPAPAGYVAPELEAGGTESGTIRKYVWEAALTAWRSTTKAYLIGTGTETFAFAFYQFRPVGHNMTSEWDFLYNKAHNEYLNYLATTGIIGLGTYVLILGVFMIWFLRLQIAKISALNNAAAQNSNIQMGEQIQTTGYLPLALFTGWISILITNFFGFSVVIMQIFLFLLPAAAFILWIDKRKYTTTTLPDNIPAVAVSAATIAVSIILLGYLFAQWYADTLYASSYRLSQSGQYAQADILIEHALTLSPGEPIYHDQLSSTLAALAVGALEQQNATVGSQLAQRAINENNHALSISPLNVSFWKTKTKIFYELSVYDPRLNADAIVALEKAHLLSPNDPKIYYNLAILYGRQGENDKAIQTLNQAIVLKPDYRDPYYALYVFYTQLKQPDQAKATLEKYLTSINSSDIQFTQLLGQMK